MAEVISMQSFVTALLSEVMGIHGGTQIFLFGPEGEPFWAASMPISKPEFRLFKEALDLIEETEEKTEPPFVAEDPAYRYTVGAFPKRFDLYVVVLDIDANRAMAEARVVAIRDDLVPAAEMIRHAVESER